MSKQKEIKVVDLLTKAELKKVEKFLVQNQPQKLRDYLNKDRRKAKLREKGVIADYLYYWLCQSAMQNFKSMNKKYEVKEQKKKEEYEGRTKQSIRENKSQEKSS